MPLAVTLDYAAAAAARLGLGPGLALSNIIASEVFTVPETGATRLEITAERNGSAVEIGVGSSGHKKRQPSVQLCATSASDSLPVLVPPPGGKTPELSIPDFYERLNFHGPRFHALTSMIEIGPTHAVGKMRASGHEGGPEGAALDVLSLDGLMQLCAYWALVNLGVTGLPVGADEVRVLARPQAGAELTAVGLVRESADGALIGDLDLLDSENRPLLQVRGLRCRSGPAQTPVER